MGLCRVIILRKKEAAGEAISTGKTVYVHNEGRVRKGEEVSGWWQLAVIIIYSKKQREEG